MEKSAEDFADDISKYFMQAMLSNAIGEQFSDKLRTWYDRFGNSMKNDGTLDSDEMDKLLNGDGDFMGWNEMVDEAMKLRDELAAATGYDKISQESTSQSASSKGFQVMSQDTGEELNGRFTALQIAGEEIKNAMLNTLAVAQAISSFAKDNNTMLTEIRNLMISSNGHLESINKYTKLIYKFGDKLDEIAKNTKSI